MKGLLMFVGLMITSIAVFADDGVGNTFCVESQLSDPNLQINTDMSICLGYNCSTPLKEASFFSQNRVQSPDGKALKRCFTRFVNTGKADENSDFYEIFNVSGTHDSDRLQPVTCTIDIEKIKEATAVITQNGNQLVCTIQSN